MTNMPVINETCAKLEDIAAEIQRDVYSIDIYLGKKMFLHLERSRSRPNSKYNIIGVNKLCLLDDDCNGSRYPYVPITTLKMYNDGQSQAAIEVPPFVMKICQHSAEQYEQILNAVTANSSQMGKLRDDIGLTNINGLQDDFISRIKAGIIYGLRYLKTFGQYKKRNILFSDHCYGQLLGWSVIREGIDQLLRYCIDANQELPQDSINGSSNNYVKTYPNEIKFYRMLGAQARYAEQRIRKLIDDFEKVASPLYLFQPRTDINDIRRIIIDRI